MKPSLINKEYDVIIIGGGITGAGTARDCAKRGLRTLLVERFDLTNGATGRNHGLLHSGARYAVTDRESATECIKENATLRRVASHCVEDTQGLFVSLPEDGLDYQAKFVEACQASGIDAQIIDPELAKRMEPAVNKDIIGAVTVPDGAVDPFRLTVSNVIDAKRHGADVLTFHEVSEFVIENGRVVGVIMHDLKNNRLVEARARITINAAGIWGHLIAEKAGVTVNMLPSKGALLIFGHRLNNMVINRCRKPADADILVPGDTICLIGTTSTRVGFDEIDDLRVTRGEVEILLREGSQIVPALSSTRIIRAYAGVRPLILKDGDESGRNISRGIVCLDHEERDGLPGFITISGGKLMTYRLMAEIATDLACAKLGVKVPCTTGIDPLPGSEHPANSWAEEMGTSAALAATGRHGTMASDIECHCEADCAMVCECEQVSVGEIRYAMHQLHADNLIALRRRTRLGMGTCQGELCACRAAGVMATLGKGAESSLEDLAKFMRERWKGMSAVAWGDTLAEAQFTEWLYAGVCGLGREIPTDLIIKKS